MSLEKLSDDWFRLKDQRRRPYSKNAWIPIAGHKYFIRENQFPNTGFAEDLLSVGSAAFFIDRKQDAESLDHYSFTSNDSPPWKDENGSYHLATDFVDNNFETVGFRLVVTQNINSLHPKLVLINEDFILAYGLIEEGDYWVRPADGYEKVIRVERDDDGAPRFVEFRSEYLRDYLAARNSALRLYYYRIRQAILADEPSFDWERHTVISDLVHDRCEVRINEIDNDGNPPGSTWAVFRSWRTDVDSEQEIPDFSAENDENTETSSMEGTRLSQDVNFRVSGEIWKAEWIEPTAESCRIGYNEPTEDLFVTPDASGTKVKLESLRYETVGKYLWFDPALAEVLLKRRGGHLNWQTAETGELSGRPDGHTHFGVNGIGLINVYAWDVAILPLWERRIWAAHNVRPDGGVSAELQTIQMECKRVRTIPPEKLLPLAVKWLDSQFQMAYGCNLFDEPPGLSELEAQLHRFRSTDENTMRTLAKDVIRFTTDRLSKTSLRSALQLQKTELGTIKLLEKLSASLSNEEVAARHLAPVFAVYDLRIADAHLANNKLNSSYDRLNLETDSPYVNKGTHIIAAVAKTLVGIGSLIKSNFKNGISE